MFIITLGLGSEAQSWEVASATSLVDLVAKATAAGAQIAPSASLFWLAGGNLVPAMPEQPLPQTPTQGGLRLVVMNKKVCGA